MASTDLRSAPVLDPRSWPAAIDGRRTQLLLWPVWLHRVVVGGTATDTDPFRRALRDVRDAGIGDPATASDILQMPIALVERLWREEDPRQSHTPSGTGSSRVMVAFRDANSGELLARFASAALKPLPLTGARDGERRLPRAPGRREQSFRVIEIDAAAAVPGPPEPQELRTAWNSWSRTSRQVTGRREDPVAIDVVQQPGELWQLPLFLVEDDRHGGWEIWDPLVAGSSTMWRPLIDRQALRDAWLEKSLMSFDTPSTRRNLALEQLARKGIWAEALPPSVLDAVLTTALTLTDLELGDHGELPGLAHFQVADSVSRLVDHCLHAWPISALMDAQINGVAPMTLIRRRIGQSIVIPQEFAHAAQADVFGAGSFIDLLTQLIDLSRACAVISGHPLTDILEDRPDALEVWCRVAVDADIASTGSEHLVAEYWDALTLACRLVSTTKGALPHG